MKREKDEEEKRLEPMFPRLHVKDAYKGGLRAPPRNKMALYEQLSIPSHRLTDHGTSLTSRSNTTSLVHHVVGPSRQLCGVERSLSAQHLDSSAVAHATDKDVSQMSVLQNVSSMDQRDQSKTVREEDDFAVPVFINSRRFQCHGRTKSGTETLVRDQVKGSAKPGGFVNSLEDMSDTEEMDCNASLRPESRNRLDRDVGENRVKSHLREERHSSEEASDDVSDDSMVDSMSCVDVSPDDVVGVLGEKRFWRARKAIANQQRVFAVQLFELHRLIKVQKLIAASPDLLFDDITYLAKVSAKSYPSKKQLPSEVMSKPLLPQVFIKPKVDSEKTNQHKMECSAENVVEKSSNQSHHHQPSNYTPPPFMSNPTASQTVNGCYFPPPPPPPLGGNQQWLIPVMSPSEGLIYKPHPGMGQTTPACGGYYGHYMPAPMVMSSIMGGGPHPFHPGVGFASHGNGYFPPYGMIPTMMNPYCSDQQQQHNQQMNQFQNTSGLNNQQQQQQQQQQMNQLQNTSGLNMNNQEQSSVKEAATPKQQTKSCPRARKSRQGGSTSGSERISGKNSFRPFLAADDDGNNNNGDEEMTTTTTTTTRTTVTQTTRDGGVTRVIKVVPHNAMQASENAARIFRSIQEERKQYDSFH